MKHILNYFLALVFVLAIVSCNPWEEHIKKNEPAIGQNIYELIKGDPSLSTFNNIIDICGYDSVLTTANTFTVFAITNENLTGIDLSDIAYLKKVLRNHIAFLSYGIENNNFKVSSIKMINGKYNAVSGTSFSIASIDTVASNRSCGNGFLHIVDKFIEPVDNIWETMSGMEGYDQIDFIKSINQKVMDLDRSIQIGFNANSQPIYDTIFYNVNTFLDRYGIDNEDSLYTFVLLENSVFSRLHTKYKKYFTYAKNDSVKELNTINYEISRDMTLLPVTISANGMKCISADGIEIDLSVDSIAASYTASNGLIYVMTGANVRMYNNKIKTQIIEGENFTGMLSQRNTEASIRIRSYARNGRDVMLSGESRMYTYVLGTDTFQSPSNNLLDKGTITNNWTYFYNTGLYSNITNAYFEYNPVLYSVPYKIYWVAYDDITSHFKGSNNIIQPALELEQKLFVSFAGRPSLVRGSAGEISNSYSTSTVFVGTSYAGIYDTTRLYRFSTDGTAQMLLNKITETNPEHSTHMLSVPFYGKAKAWVTNSPRATGQYSGMLFLDFIMFQPVIDTNE